MKPRAPRNQTISITEADVERLSGRIVMVPSPPIYTPTPKTEPIGMRPLDSPHAQEPSEPFSRITEGTICSDCLQAFPWLPRACVDLAILDPPYNMTKSFNGKPFARRPLDEYAAWLDGILTALKPILTPTATVYICGEWNTSMAIAQVASRHFIVQNRITWEREKGRGAKSNWKNASEDIWFCTVSANYHFDAHAVKLRRRVIAPYRDTHGQPKDWQDTSEGKWRDTHPSNLWTDITVPFWSMPENTDHPTQKSEKLLAKLILASSRPGDLVLDPFLGSGTTSVTAKKLGRRYLGIEQDFEFCLIAERRLELATDNPTIQGYDNGMFWERNSQRQKKR